MFNKKQIRLGVTFAAISAASILATAAPAGAFTWSSSGSPGQLNTYLVASCGDHADYWSPGGIDRDFTASTIVAGPSPAGGYPQTVTESMTVYWAHPGDSGWSVLRLTPATQTIFAPYTGWAAGTAILTPPEHVNVSANMLVTSVATFVWRSGNGTELGRTTLYFNQAGDYSTSSRFTRISVNNFSGTYTGAGCFFQT